VIDLRLDPPRTVNTVSAGTTPEGIKLSADGRWCAVVAQEGSNRPTASPFYNARGKLVVFELKGTQLISDWPEFSAAPMAAQFLRGSFQHEDLRGIVVFCAGVGQSRHFPGNLPTKAPSVRPHKNILHPARKSVHR
jgi:hypothetical protein